MSTDINMNSDAFNDGYESAKQGDERKSPYPSKSWETDNWIAGYDAGKKVASFRTWCQMLAGMSHY